MKKNNFRFTSSKLHTNHLESPLNNYIDQTTKNIFGPSFTNKNKKEFLYATIWLDQVRIGTLKTEITFENNNQNLDDQNLIKILQYSYL